MPVRKCGLDLEQKVVAQSVPLEQSQDSVLGHAYTLNPVEAHRSFMSGQKSPRPCAFVGHPGQGVEKVVADSLTYPEPNEIYPGQKFKIPLD